MVTGENQPEAHPIYATNDPAVIAEYERVMADRDRYVSLHARAESEAERYQFALEDIVITAEAVLAAQRRLNQAALPGHADRTAGTGLGTTGAVESRNPASGAEPSTGSASSAASEDVTE